MDQSENMVRHVWPGDIPQRRRAVVGNWIRSGLASGSQDIVIGDGGFNFFDFPASERALIHELHRILRPGGLFIYRHTAQRARRESLAEVLGDLHAGRIGNFHIFKWRIAMALQRDVESGIRQCDIWQAVMAAGIERAAVLGPHWSQRSIDTIRFYRDKESRLYFPTLEEFQALLSEVFKEIEVVLPTYEMGDRFPIISAYPMAS